MKLKKFKVKNYKIFKNFFSVELIKNIETNGNFTILTGKNNMGKSTFLEAINEFYKQNSKAQTINTECFNIKTDPILLVAELAVTKDKDKEVWIFLEEKGLLPEGLVDDQILKITKTYLADKAASYVASINGNNITTPKDLKDLVSFINKEEPYYIRPNMTTEEIDKLISTIYADAISASSNSDIKTLEDINQKIKEAISILKSDTDSLLKKVETNVSTTLNQLFKNQDFKIKIDGGEPSSFSIKDLLKNTDTKITIDSNSKSNMLLAEQGTGVQRMSLIYTIQNIINQNIGTLGNRMLLIDEPEAFLHPEATRQLSSSLYEIGNSMPIIITTHSPILINLENDHTVIDIFKIDKNNSDAIILYTSEEAAFTINDIENMKILNYVDSHVNEFFFSDKNIIVEGSTEKLVLQYIQNLYKIPFHVINANGKSTIATIMKILNQFDTSYYVLHDLDSSSDHKESTLKAEQTKCKQIFRSKHDNAKIYAHDYTFEKVFYGESVSSRTKTRKIFDILNSEETDTEKYSIRQDILQTFNKIFELEIDGLNPLIFNNKTIEIISENIIEKQFEPLLFVPNVVVESK